MTKDLTTIEDKLLSIVTRATDSPLQLHVFDEDKIAKIAAGMPEIHRATRAFGRRNTQTTNRLMTLTMLADASPYRVIRQCLAQIENKREAIKEARFKILKSRNRIKSYKKKLEVETDEIAKELLEIKLEEKLSGLADSILYVEGALKEIASFQSSYQQICRNKGLPEDWDEEDMEKAEVEHHLRIAFLHAYRDLMAHGRLGMGTLEYLQQFGVHPQIAFEQTVKYIDSTQDNGADYEHLECWLDDRVEENKENYRMVLNRIGIETLYETWYQYKEDEHVAG